MEKLTVIFISLITTIITGVLTHLLALKNDRRKEKYELEKQQRHEYFLPFKYCAKEFLERIKHIEQRLHENDSKVKQRFSQETFLVEKPLAWYFATKNDEGLGGYFIASTVYMNCLLFYRIREIQWKYPFIPLRFKKTISDFNNTIDYQMNRCVDSWKTDKNNSTLNIAGIKYKHELNIDEIIELIRVPIALKRGIPYSLHDSYGDFVWQKKGLMNFEEFAKELANKEKSIKYKPIIDFWTQISDINGEIDELRLDKLRKLILILTFIQHGEVK